MRSIHINNITYSVRHVCFDFTVYFYFFKKFPTLNIFSCLSGQTISFLTVVKKFFGIIFARFRSSRWREHIHSFSCFSFVRGRCSQRISQSQSCDYRELLKLAESALPCSEQFIVSFEVNKNIKITYLLYLCLWKVIKLSTRTYFIFALHSAAVRGTVRNYFCKIYMYGPDHSPHFFSQQTFFLSIYVKIFKISGFKNSPFLGLLRSPPPSHFQLKRIYVPVCAYGRYWSGFYK